MKKIFLFIVLSTASVTYIGGMDFWGRERPDLIITTDNAIHDINEKDIIKNINKEGETIYNAGCSFFEKKAIFSITKKQNGYSGWLEDAGGENTFTIEPRISRQLFELLERSYQKMKQK